MKSCEKLISPESDYFVYAPGKAAHEMFFYPLQCGRFIYEPGYCLRRESYDSFLLMYIAGGRLVLEWDGQHFDVPAGSFVLLDCYQRHAYSAPVRCECLWCHFDGVSARRWYESVLSHLGPVFCMPDSHSALDKLTAVYDTFALRRPIREPLLSKYLTDILTSFLLYIPSQTNRYSHSNMAEETVAYISEHFAEDLAVEELAERAGLSQYYFIRIFKQETGFTPHEYLINTRIAAAKYLLKNSVLAVKDICFRTGFSCESVFCSSFKKRLGMTPAQYRASEAGTGDPDAVSAATVCPGKKGSEKK